MNMAQKPPSRLPKPVPRVKRTREDQEFLPAALEILETPPSPVRMAFILFIVGLAISVLAWTWLGKFDIVATAQGKIQPAGRVKVIQSAVLAKVVSPPVANGQVIKAGDVLLELDSTEMRAEKAALASALSAWRAEAIRREASLATITGAAPSSGARCFY
ncbi:biotin/lipoyl-binding protein [Agrobacterium tumefaciens]|uniref:biotin/lipoyl-binding protein n=1 Tax=Agrobacterium tumefaciens TaxID=358 RepID=UPI001CBF65DD|nr:biotin/lipoyl-binding protein [Agrobacterium tumefaciens]